MRDYRTLAVWQRSHAIVLRIYAVTRAFPIEERYGLTSQMRRAAASVPANIAEGCGRIGDPELKRFLAIAIASACELDYFITLALDLGYLGRDDGDCLARENLEVRRMLGGFVRRLRIL